MRRQITALCDIFWGLVGNFDEAGAFFGRGRLQARYRPRLKAGNHITGEFKYPPSHIIRAGAKGKPGWSAYAESVTRSVQVGRQDGQITAHTSVEFSRFVELGLGVYPFIWPLRNKHFTGNFADLDYTMEGDDVVEVPDE